MVAGNVSRGAPKSAGGVTVLSDGDDARTWSQRYKANLEKLASGDLVQVVEVVRDLAGQEARSGLSAGRSACWPRRALSCSRRADAPRILSSLSPRPWRLRVSAPTTAHAERRMRRSPQARRCINIRLVARRSRDWRGRSTVRRSSDNRAPTRRYLGAAIASWLGCFACPFWVLLLAARHHLVISGQVGRAAGVPVALLAGQELIQVPL